MKKSYTFVINFLFAFIIINLFSFNNVKSNTNKVTDSDPTALFDNSYISQENIDFNSNDEISMEHFFKNSYLYSPKNFSSCGFVSFIQLLSYYDTFLNDDIIPEEYEDRRTINANTINDLQYESPGVRSLAPYRSQYSTYYQYCHATMHNDFQSFLTVQKNKIFKTDNDNLYYDENTNSMKPYFATSIDMTAFNSLVNYIGGEISQISFNTEQINNMDNSSETEKNRMYNLVKQQILNNKPVLVHIKKNNNDGSHALHSVIAYKVENDIIYANFGWNSIDTFRPLIGGVHGYNFIYKICYVDVSLLQQKHSDHYIIDNVQKCGCNLSDKLTIKVPSERNNIPMTISWMKNLSDSNETYTIKFRLGKNSADLYSLTTSYNQITLSNDVWAALRNYSSTILYIYFKRNSSIVDSPPSYTIINDPSIDMRQYVLKPNNLYTQSLYSINFSSNLNIDNRIFGVAGDGFKNENNELVMSAKESNLLNSYLTITTSFIYRVDLKFSLYSSNEFPSFDVTLLTVEYLNVNNVWKSKGEFIKTNALSNNQYNNFYITFPEPCLGIRIKLGPNAGMNYLNGRIKIGDITIYANN